MVLYKKNVNAGMLNIQHQLVIRLDENVCILQIILNLRIIFDERKSKFTIITRIFFQIYKLFHSHNFLSFPLRLL